MYLSAVKLDYSGELFWDTTRRLSAWVSVFLAWRTDLNNRVPTLFAHCEKNDLEIFLYIKAEYVPLNGLCLDFFRDFIFFIF